MKQKVFFQKKKQLLFLFLSFTLFCSLINAQGFLKAKGKIIVNAKGANVLLRGEGLGGWMLQEGYMLGIEKESQQNKIKSKLDAMMGADETAEFYDAWLHNFVTKSDIDSMHSWGFNSVRLPMHYNLYTLPIEKEPVTGENTWLSKGFQLTDSLLSWCKANKMYLILDLHAAPGGQGNDLNIADRDSSNGKPSLWESEANQKKTVALWKKLAERYKNEQWIGGYDILNEPNWGFTNPVTDPHGQKEMDNTPIKKLYQQITTAIRSVDKNHLIIIEGNAWGNNYNKILPAWDNNTVLSFHKYWDYNKQENIQRILDARNKYNIPVWLGETGENSNVWFTQVIHLLETNNIGWSMWPLKKMGANNPLEIQSNLNYNEVKNYLNGAGIKPKESNVYSGTLELAVYANIENNIFHKDVIDALFRQPFSTKAIPYNNYTLTDSLMIHAVDYDLGRNGVAYYDMDTANYWVSGKSSEGNRGHVYRNDGVDIYKDSSKYATYYVGNTESGEWLQYTTYVANDGIYNFTISCMGGKDEGALGLSSNAQPVKEIPVPVADKSEWVNIMIKNYPLKKGINELRLKIIKGGFKIESIYITK